SDVAPFRLSMERIAELVLQLAADGHRIRFIDAGGGLGISYKGQEHHGFNDLAEDYANALIEPLLKIKDRPHLLLEPGRSIIAPAGVLLTRVLYRKQNGAKRFTIVDAAMNDLIRPSLYGARHEIVPVAEKDTAELTTDVAGPICETGDFLARDAVIPSVD